MLAAAAATTHTTSLQVTKTTAATVTLVAAVFLGSTRTRATATGSAWFRPADGSSSMFVWLAGRASLATTFTTRRCRFLTSRGTTITATSKRFGMISSSTIRFAFTLAVVVFEMMIQAGKSCLVFGG